MIIKDAVYGRTEIGDPVLIELIKSAPMQRLKGVSQAGFPRNVQRPPLPFYYRYEHCVGVMLLLRKLNASLEEQTAGLLHDVSHTAFSHTIDAALGDYSKQGYQDSAHKRYVKSTIIPKILARHGFDVDRVTNIESYPLLERPAPALCADRVDYTLRDLRYSVDPHEVDFLVAGLTVVNDEIIFKSKKHAKLFGVDYLKCQNSQWAQPTHVAKAYFLANLLKKATDKGILRKSDIFKTDSYLIDKIKHSRNNELKEGLALLPRKLSLHIENRNPEYIIKAKRRYVDPKYIDNGRVYALSEKDSSYKKLIEKNPKIVTEGMRVRLRFS